MKKQIRTSRTRPTPGQRILASVEEVTNWANGTDLPVRVSQVERPGVDVRALRQGLGLSQSEFAHKFGFQTTTLRNWEQGRTQPDGPARTLLAVIAKHPEAVEDSLRPL
jgi:putative transcriptional regulator